MGYLKIYCCGCKQTWEVYHRNLHDDNARFCPHCGCKIHKDAWEKAQAAVKAMDDFNISMALMKSHTGAFEAEYHPNCYFHEV